MSSVACCTLGNAVRVVRCAQYLARSILRMICRLTHSMQLPRLRTMPMEAALLTLSLLKFPRWTVIIGSTLQAARLLGELVQHAPRCRHATCNVQLATPSVL